MNCACWSRRALTRIASTRDGERDREQRPEEQEYEERAAVGFQLERLTKRFGELRPIAVMSE